MFYFASLLIDVIFYRISVQTLTRGAQPVINRRSREWFLTAKALIYSCSLSTTSVGRSSPWAQAALDLSFGEEGIPTGQAIWKSHFHFFFLFNLALHGRQNPPSSFPDGKSWRIISLNLGPNSLFTSLIMSIIPSLRIALNCPHR